MNLEPKMELVRLKAEKPEEVAFVIADSGHFVAGYESGRNVRRASEQNAGVDEQREGEQVGWNWGQMEFLRAQQNPERPLKVRLIPHGYAAREARDQLVESFVAQGVTILEQGGCAYTEREVAAGLCSEMLGWNPDIYAFAVDFCRTGEMRFLLSSRWEPKFLAILDPYAAPSKQPGSRSRPCKGLQFRVSRWGNLQVAWDIMLQANNVFEKDTPGVPIWRTLISEHHCQNLQRNQYSERTYRLTLETVLGKEVAMEPEVSPTGHVQLARVIG